MTEQAFIQVRIDSDLKKEATDILDELGMDMPNAVRMFVKRIVMERGLPFDVKLPNCATVAEATESIEIDNHAVDYIPPIPVKPISMQEYIDLLYKVPAGKVTRMIDIERYLEKRHGVAHVNIEFTVNYANPLWEGIPLWREVSTRGMLQDTKLCSRDNQEAKLREEGLSVVPCGAYQRSLKVENYVDYLYDFDNLSETGNRDFGGIL